MQYSLVILIWIYRMYWLSTLESIMIWNFLDNHYLELPFWQLRCTSFVQCFNFHHMKDILKKSLENVMGRKIICYIFSFVRNGQVCCLLTWSKMPSKYFFTNFVFYELALLKNSYLQLTACAEIVFFKCSAMTFPTAKSAFSSHNWNILDSFCSSKSIQELAIPLYRDYLGRCVWEWSGILWKGDIIGQKALIFPHISIVFKANFIFQTNSGGVIL